MLRIIGYISAVILIISSVILGVSYISIAGYENPMACYHVFHDDKNSVLIRVKNYGTDQKTEVCVDYCHTIEIKKNLEIEVYFENLIPNFVRNTRRVYDVCFQYHYNIDYTVFGIFENGHAIEYQRDLRGGFFEP